MFYHLLHDDKFVDEGYQRFEEAFPNENIYILTEKKEKLNYIKKTPVLKLSLNETVEYLKAKYVNNDKIIIHFLRIDKVKIVNKLPKSFTVIWLGWGGDYYNLIYQREKDYYLDETFKWVKAQRKGIQKLYGMLNDKTGFNINRNTWPYKKTYKRIKYMNTVIPDDYKLIKEKHPEFKPEYLSWNYVNMTYLDSKLKLKENAQNILIGNSADSTNNQLEILNFLTTIDLGERKLICPLSYGNKEYAKLISKHGKSLFGENFIPLTEFIPLEEYYKIIATCSVVFMNQLRQQALGNIITLLLIGSRIILQEKNPLFSFFKENGFYINSFQEIEKNTDLIYRLLSDSERTHNRNLCENIWGNEMALKRTLEIGKLK
jgi:hypothetical protein